MELGNEALRYARDRAWPVLPAPLLDGGAGLPAASRDERTVRRWWRQHPAAEIVLPTGDRFDALDVPAAAGSAALSWLRACGLPPGPVLVESGRWLFLVAAAARLGPGLAPGPDGVGRLDAVEADVGYRGPGGWLVAPPSLVRSVPVRWEVPPERAARHWPAGVELLGLVAAAAAGVRRRHRHPTGLAS